MEYSKGFAALDTMIEKDWIVVSITDFDQMLKQLEGPDILRLPSINLLCCGCLEKKQIKAKVTPMNER